MISILKNISILLFALLFSESVLAQQGARKENVEAYRIAYFTKELALTPEEAKVFWPVYNNYQAEMQSARKERKQAVMAGKANSANLSDQQIEAMVDNEIVFKQNMLNIEKKYNDKFKQVLPIAKVAKLYQAQEGFKRELVRKIQER